MKTKIYIEVQGGSVQRVFSDLAEDVEVVIIDHDNGDVDLEEEVTNALLLAEAEKTNLIY